jgi:hypothetical protein
VTAVVMMQPRSDVMIGWFVIVQLVGSLLLTYVSM